MYIMTHHGTILAFDPNTHVLKHLREPVPEGEITLVDLELTEIIASQLLDERAIEEGILIPDGPLAGYVCKKSPNPTVFHLSKNGLFACARSDSEIVICDRPTPLEWESFQFVPSRSSSAQEDAFCRKVFSLQQRGNPVCLHFGCGPRRIKGFLNIDKSFNFSDDLGEPYEYFLFDFAERKWPVPDSCADYIYSEDFIEHIPQKHQISFLAESFRVLKTGCYNRINTPCLSESMKLHSNFSKGFDGVYFGEYDRWEHVSLFTRSSLQELASMIGYRQVFFTTKNNGTSPHRVSDRRPAGDRDDITGNIFADLLK